MGMTTTTEPRQMTGTTFPKEGVMSRLPSTFRAGARVQGRFFNRAGTITRVIDAEGELGGLVEVRWDGQRSPSRSAGFFSPQEIEVVEETTLVRHQTGLVWIG